jgi:hypothetical protein
MKALNYIYSANQKHKLESVLNCIRRWSEIIAALFNFELAVNAAIGTKMFIIFMLI